MAQATERYRSDIQGLRALAVAPVVLFHVDSRWMPGGFVGVDIFFVISGYLITQILLRDLEQGRFSILGFYERRVKRLFPALYAMLAVTLFAGWFILSPADYAEAGRTALATVFFASNLMFYSLSGYFDGAAELKPLLHTWSLAVEEQFYLAYPLVLAAVWRWWREALKPTLWIGLAGSLALCLLAMKSHQSAAFYLPMTRAWELLAGAVIAAGAVPAARSRAQASLASLIGLVLVAASLMFIDRSMPFPGVLAVPPVLGAALLLWSGEAHETQGAQLLSLTPLVWLGGLSYSLYLWHWPVLVFERYLALGHVDPGRQLAALALALLLAWGSLRWIEQPVLRAKPPRVTVLAGGLATMGLGAVAALVLVAGQGIPSRFSPSTLALFEAARDASPHRTRCHGDGWSPMTYDRHCVFGAAEARPRTVVWGDSFGAEIAVALGEAEAARGRSVMQITSSACPPTLGFTFADRPRCDGLNRQTLAALEGDSRIDTVMMVANFARYAPDTARMLAGFEAAAARLAAAGKRLIIAYPMPLMPADAPRALGLLAHAGHEPRHLGQPLVAHREAAGPLEQALDRIVARFDARALKPAEILCRSGLCRAYDPAVGVLYFDAEHLSMAGARHLIDAGAGRIAAMLR